MNGTTYLLRNSAAGRSAFTRRNQITPEPIPDITVLSSAVINFLRIIHRPETRQPKERPFAGVLPDLLCLTDYFQSVNLFFVLDLFVVSVNDIIAVACLACALTCLRTSLPLGTCCALSCLSLLINLGE